MERICGCKVVGFGAKPIGYVLDVIYNEEEVVSFVIKEYIQKEVEEHLEYEEKECINLNVDENISLEELVKVVKQEVNQRSGKEEELFVQARVLHEMYAKFE